MRHVSLKEQNGDCNCALLFFRPFGANIMDGA